MPKRLAETQLTQDNADQYLEEEGDQEEVREVTSVLFETLFYCFLAHLFFNRVATSPKRTRRP